MQICQDCKHSNAEGARFCQECGKTLPVAQAVDSADKAADFCHACGTALAAEATFCATCGAAQGALCGQCRTANVAEAKFCAGCGSPRAWVCAMCQTPNAAGAVYCAHCGKESQATGLQLWLHSPWRLSAAAVVLLLMLWQGVAYYRYHQHIEAIYTTADNKAFADAQSAVSQADASSYLLKGNTLQQAKDYMQEQEDSYNRQQQAAQASRGSGNSGRTSGGSSSSSRGSTANKPDLNRFAYFRIHVKFDGIVEEYINHFTVRIKRIQNLNGKYMYDNGDTKEVNCNYGLLDDNYATFYCMVGYYEVEYWGYDKEWGKEMFRMQYSGVLHKGNIETVGNFFTNDRQPYFEYH